MVYAAAGTRDHESSQLNPYSEIADGNGDIFVYPYQEAYFADTKWSAQGGVRFEFETGPLGHQLVVGASGIRFDTGWRGTYSDGVVVPPGYDEYASNLYQPVYPAAPSLIGVPADGDLQLENELTSYAIVDTISILDGRLQVTGGIRRQEFEIHRLYDDVTPFYDDGAWSPSVGVLGKLTDSVSLYANYLTGLSQGQFAPVGTANQNEQFDPEETEQFEIGAKAQFGELFTSLALFQITQPAGLTNPVTNIFSVDGEQRHRGIEWTFAGEVRRGVRVLGGANYIDATLTETEGGLLDGNSAPGVPDVTANIGGEYDVGTTGLTLTGRLVYTGDAYVFGDNLQSIPDWTRLDLGARYVTGIRNSPLTLRLNAINVTGADYWASAQGSGLSLGVPRSVFLSATLSF
jgi:iron complex outermembrane receptor protein